MQQDNITLTFEGTPTALPCRKLRGGAISFTGKGTPFFQTWEGGTTYHEQTNTTENITSLCTKHDVGNEIKLCISEFLKPLLPSTYDVCLLTGGGTRGLWSLVSSPWSFPRGTSPVRHVTGGVPPVRSVPQVRPVVRTGGTPPPQA